MKIGESFYVDLTELVEPLKGRLITLEVNGTPVKARIMSFDSACAKLAVVPDGTKE